MQATASKQPAPPELETAEGFATFMSEALASRDQAVIEEAFAAVARTGGKSRTASEPAAAQPEPPAAQPAPPAARFEPAGAPRERLDPAAAIPPSSMPQRGKVRRFALPGLVVVGALASLCAGSLSLNRPESHPVPARRATLEARARALAAQVAAETARFDELHAEAGLAAQQLASLSAIHAEIARASGTLDSLQTRIKQATRKLTAPRAPVRVATATSNPAPARRYSPADAVEIQWRHEGAQLVAARGALIAGNTPQAKQLIEAVQTQLVFQPVTPDDPTPPGIDDPTAKDLTQALAFLDRGQAMQALHLLNRAIAYLGA